MSAKCCVKFAVDRSERNAIGGQAFRARGMEQQLQRRAGPVVIEFAFHAVRQAWSIKDG